jgi:hypothetical protein
MTQPLRPGVFTEMFAKLSERAEAVMHAGLEGVAEAIEEEVRSSFVGKHALGTPTPARRGGPPSRISETLEDSLGHSDPEHDITGMHIRVGVFDGHYPPYSDRVDSATYGHYLEVEGAGKSHVRYPFLVPAFDRVAGSSSRVVEIFRTFPWL